MSVLRPDLMMKCVVPVIMAGIIAVRRNCLSYMRWKTYECILDLRSRRLCPDCQRPYVHWRIEYTLFSTTFAVEVEMPLAKGFVQLGAGLAVGLAGLAAGFAIGIVGDAGVRGTAQQPRLFVGMVRSTPTFCFLPRSEAFPDPDPHFR